MKKTLKNQNAAHSNSQSSKPFFNKSGEQTFFSGSKEVESPFFTPSNIQTKLTIGEPGDKYEQEADTMAEKVVQKLDASNSTSVVQNKCDDCVQEEELQKIEEEEMKISKKPIFENKNYKIQAKSIENQLRNSKGKGKPLPDKIRLSMESAFGNDFTHVRVHNNSESIQMSKQLNARAFTNESDIYFNQNEYNTSSTKGKKLLAHELTHTIQQKGVNSSDKIDRQTQTSLVLPAATAAVPWSLFWKEVIKRFAVRGATAAGLALIDGPLPIGDLIALGLSIWTIYEIIELWDVLWAAAATTYKMCQDKYVDCTDYTPNYDCGSCLSYCLVQGTWPTFRCP